MGTVCGCGNKRPLQKEERDRIKAFTASPDTRNIILQLETFKQDVKKINALSIASYLDVFFEILNTKANTYQQKLHVILLLDSALSNNPITVNLFRKHPIQKLLLKEITPRIGMDHIINYQRNKKYNWQERYDNAVLELFENCTKNFANELPEIQNFCHVNSSLFPRPSSFLKINTEMMKSFDAQLSFLNRRNASEVPDKP
jgi:hypothetical protein